MKFRCRCGCGRICAPLQGVFYDNACREAHRARPKDTSRKREGARRRYGVVKWELSHPHLSQADKQKRPGIYAFFRKQTGEVLKVGSTVNMQLRIRQQSGRYGSDVGVRVLCWLDGPPDRRWAAEGWYQRHYGLAPDHFVVGALRRLGIDPVEFFAKGSGHAYIWAKAKLHQ